MGREARPADPGGLGALRELIPFLLQIRYSAPAACFSARDSLQNG